MQPDENHQTVTDSEGERLSRLLAASARAAIILAAAGCMFALGTRVLVERAVGGVPYAMPPSIGVLAMIALASVSASAFVAWASQIEDARLRPSTVAARLAAVVLVVGLLRGAHKRASDITVLSTPMAPLAAVETRARLRPQHAASQFALGKSYYRVGRYADAAGPLARAMALTDGAAARGTTSRVDTSQWREPLRSKPLHDQAAALYALTRAHLVPGDAALKYYREAYEKGEHTRRSVVPMVEILMKQRRYGEAHHAINIYKTGRYIDPALLDMWMRADGAERVLDAARSECSTRRGISVRERISQLEEAIRRDSIDTQQLPLPYPVTTRMNRLTAAININPNDASATSELANLRLAVAESQLADEYIALVLGCRKAPVKGPFNPDQFNVALAHARHAATLAPRMADYQAKLGEVLTLGEHYQEADRAFEEAFAIDASFYAAHRGIWGRGFAHSMVPQAPPAAQVSKP